MSHCSTKNVINTATYIGDNSNEIQLKDVASTLISNSLFRVIEATHKEFLLFNTESTIRVTILENSFASKTHVGQIISPRLAMPLRCVDGRVQVSRLVEYQQPTGSINIFDLVPFDWVQDRSLIQRASAILNSISEAHRLLFNAIFWNADRFKRFCIQPSSLIGHHSELNGNLRHTVEVAEFMCKLCTERSFANPYLGILAALLHDSGKSDEYIATNHGSWYMSERGKLLGHKITALEWISATTAKWNIQLPKDHYEGLLHVLTAAPNAPEWLGIRQPALPEAHLLSIADRLSGSDDLMHKTVNISGGFGQSHKHLKSPPFLVRG